MWSSHITVERAKLNLIRVVHRAAAPSPLTVFHEMFALHLQYNIDGRTYSYLRTEAHRKVFTIFLSANFENFKIIARRFIS